MINDFSKKPFDDYQKEASNLQQSMDSLNVTLANLQTRQRQMQSTWEKYDTSFEINAKNIDSTRKRLAELNTQLDDHKKILNGAKGSLLQNKDLLEILENKYKELSRSQGDNAKQVKDINIQIGHLNQTISEQEKKLETSRKVFDFQKASIDALADSFDNIKNSNEQFGPVLNDVTAGFNAMKGGLEHVKTGFKTVDGAIKTTGFGLLVLVLQSVIEYFTKTTEGMAKLRGGIAVIGLVVNNVKSVISGFLGTFGKSIVDAVSNPAETIKKVWNAVFDNMMNRFKGISVFFEGLFSGDLKKMGDGVIQMGTGITNGTDKVKKAFNQTTQFVKEAGKQIVKTYEEGTKADNKATTTAQENERKAEELRRKQQAAIIKQGQLKERSRQLDKKAGEERLASIARMSEAVLDGYAKEIYNTNKHFEELKKKYAGNKTTVAQIEKERVATLAGITTRFQQEELLKLEDYQKQALRLQIENIKDAKERALAEINLYEKDELEAFDKKYKALEKQIKNNNTLKQTTSDIKSFAELNTTVENDKKLLATMDTWKTEFTERQKQKREEVNGTNINAAAAEAKPDYGSNQSENENVFALQQALRNREYDAVEKHEQSIDAMHKKYGRSKLDLEMELTNARLKLGDRFLDNVLKNSKKDSAIFKAAFLAKKATSIADVIISTRESVMSSFKAYSGIPFIGQALGIAQAAFMAAQGASSIAQIAKQKPGFAMGGHFVSDGRGALLPGYSRTDNTNAYLRSGEAVVVSEAMRNPWARNLVSAINVAHGGRDFSAPASGRGYATGGIFTDGGNAGRYYSQPVNDVKDLANTLAYQMINNFPPVYVDVKDINTQQSILARTINRVNL